MEKFDVYVLVLCCIVYIGLATLFSILITMTTKQTIKLTRLGTEDEKIKTEYLKQKKGTKVWNVLDKVVSVVLLIAMCAVFAFSVYMNATTDKAPNGIPSLKVVKSPSMSFVHEDNTYLTENGITDQIQTFDIVVTRHLPNEYELKLYDIILYENDNGMMVIHRIVGIEEPTENHPDCRHFVLQGDANAYPDKIPVYYSQMRGIYRGERVPFVGSFVLFMQSPAGVMCILLVLIGFIAAPIMEKSIEKQKRLRLEIIGAIPSPDAEKPVPEEAEVQAPDEGGDEA